MIDKDLRHLAELANKAADAFITAEKRYDDISDVADALGGLEDAFFKFNQRMEEMTSLMDNLDDWRN